MSFNIKVGGNWEEITAPHIKVGGTWQAVQEGWVKVAGAWEQFFAVGSPPAALLDTSGVSGEDSFTPGNFGYSEGVSEAVYGSILNPVTMDSKIVSVILSNATAAQIRIREFLSDPGVGWGNFVIDGTPVSSTGYGYSSGTATWDFASFGFADSVPFTIVINP